MSPVEHDNILRFRLLWLQCTRLIFAEAARYHATPHNHIFSPEIYQSLWDHASSADNYAESLLANTTIQFQIACGQDSPWEYSTFADLPQAIPNQPGIYIMIFRASPEADPRFPTTGLDIYCGQAAAPRGNQPGRLPRTAEAVTKI